MLDDYGIEDQEKRKEANKEKAVQLLTAIAIKYLSKEGNLTKAQKDRNKATIPLVTTALLTPVVPTQKVTLPRDEYPNLERHRQALKDANKEFEGPQGRKIQVGNSPYPISVKFDIIDFNYAVNEQAGLAKITQWNQLNSESLKKLKEAKEEAIKEMQDKQKNLQLEISSAQTRIWLIQQDKVSEDPADFTAQIQADHQKFLKIEKDINKIQQLWERIDERGKGKGVDYEMPALISNLAFLIGHMVHYNCKSGKDRTGMADVETKFLAYQMEERAKRRDQQLVPSYKDELSQEDKGALKTLIFESGNLEVQKYNTGFAGYKVKTPNLVKRLGQDVLNQARGLAAEYTNVEKIYEKEKKKK